MWTTCLCIWMLPIHKVCLMGGVDMHSLAWPWLIKFIISTQSEKVLPCLYYSLGFFSFFFKREGEEA